MKKKHLRTFSNKKNIQNEKNAREQHTKLIYFLSFLRIISFLIFGFLIISLVILMIVLFFLSKKSPSPMKNPHPQLEAQGITDKKILQAIRSLPRELFVPENYRASAYDDSALPIRCGQTISQPFIVAYMTEKLELKNNDKVLEVGTGSGFQAAVLAQLVSEVHTVEVYSELSQQAQKLLDELGYKNVKYKVGNGKLGWKEKAPFDKIIITAVASEIPQLLVEQLKVDGKMILPLKTSEGEEYLVLITKNQAGKFEKKQLIPVRFVPLVS